MRIFPHGSPRAARGFTAAAVLVLALVLSGCLADNDEYAQVRRERDDINGELQKLRRENDHLNLEISRLYQECDLLSTQVALTAALALHDRFTADLGRAARPPQSSSRQAAQPARQRGGSAVQGPAPARNTGSPSGGSGQAAPSGGASSRPAGSGDSSAPGGTSRPVTPPPPPPPLSPPPPLPPSPSRSSGAVDWGM